MKAWMKAVVVLAGLTMAAPAMARTKHGRPTVEGVANLNQASAAQLDMLPGVSPKAAAAIVAYRAQHPFTRTEEVVKVKFIGKKRFERLKPYLAVQGPTTLHKLARAKRAQGRTRVKR